MPDNSPEFQPINEQRNLLSRRFTEFVVRHNVALTRLGYGSFAAALPLAALTGVHVDEGQTPTILMGTVGVGLLGVSLGAAGDSLTGEREQQ